MSLGLGMGLWIGHNPATSGGGAPDTTAPTLSSPVGTQTGSTTATIGATTNEGNGTMYGVVTTSSTPPTATQVKAGQNNGGTAAVFAGSVAVSSTGAKTISATGLTASTAYYAHIMHEDAAGNKSSVVSSAQFTTAAVAAQWSAANSNANWTISGASNNIATLGGAGADTMAKGNTSHNGAGDWSFTLNMSSTSNDFVGLANATQTTALGHYVGESVDSVGWSKPSGDIRINGVTATNGAIGLNWSDANTLTIRLKNGKLYVARDGTYPASMNPTTETGGVDVSGLGALFPAISSYFSGNVYTANFTGWA